MPAYEDPKPVAQTQEIDRILVDAARTGAADFFGGKRAQLRFQARKPFEMEADVNDSRLNFAVALHDISATGLSCWSKHRLEDKAPVRLREFTGDDSGVWIAARVAHCTPGIRGYLVGARFEHATTTAVLERLAAESEPQTIEPQPVGLWSRLVRALGLAF